MIRAFFACLRHPLSWRACIAAQEAKRAASLPKVQEWDAEGKAAVLSAYETKCHLEEQRKTWANDPITQAVMGNYPQTGKPKEQRLS